MSFSTETLLGVFSALTPYNNFNLNLLFPEVAMFDSEKIVFDELFPDQTLAPFVSPVLAGKANTAEGGVQKSFVPPYVKPKDVIKPDRILKRRPGEPIGGNLSSEQRRNAIVVDIFDNQRQKIINRKEWMACQLITTGKIVVEGEDYPRVEIDFGRRENHTVTLVGDARWGQVDEDPNGDLEDWMNRLDAPCTHIEMGGEAFTQMMKNDEMKELVTSRRGSETTLEMAPSAMKVTFRGRLGDGGPEIWTNTDWYIDDDGNKQFYIPQNSVNFVSTGASGVIAHGAILDKKAGYQPLEFFPKTWEMDDPSVEYAMTQSAPLPVLPLINSTLSAIVK